MTAHQSTHERVVATRRSYRLILPIVAAACLAHAGSATAATTVTSAPRYAATILSTLSPNPALSSLSNAAGINDRGLIVGDANYPKTSVVGGYPPNTTEHATTWKNGRISDLGTLGGPNSSIGFVARPNNAGLISGNAQTATLDPFNEGWALNLSCTAAGAPCPGSQYEIRGFVWKDGVMRPLPTLGGNNALGIGVASAQGQLVGTAENAVHDLTCQPPQVLDWEAVVWGPRYGEIHELPPLPGSGDTIGAANAINDRGEVVGASGSCASPGVPASNLKHALLWYHGSTVDLGNLGGTLNNLATGINDRGQAIGISDLPGDVTFHAFLWQHGRMSDLGTLPGDAFSFPFSINDNGDVVGQSCDLSGNCRAFLWHEGTISDLNTITAVTTAGTFYLPLAEGINSRGEIVGMAVDQSTGNTLGFAAVPCGTPSTESSSCAERPEGTIAPGPLVGGSADREFEPLQGLPTVLGLSRR